MLHNENSRVKIPALVHFTRLGYEYLSLKNYTGKDLIDEDTNIFIDLLCDAINRINGIEYTIADTQKLVNELKLVLDNEDIGRAFYTILLNGYKGIKLIDFDDFSGTRNSFNVVTELTYKNGSDEFRPDIIPLINGIPLAFIEVKKPNNKNGIKAEYTFINYSKSNYNYSPYTQYEEDFDTHHVIGQEFDNVLMLMDKSFYYDTNNILQGIPHPNPDYLYPNLFYQGITRVREKIALVVVDAPELFEKISSIVD